jgi:hypothetical protein
MPRQSPYDIKLSKAKRAELMGAGTPLHTRYRDVNRLRARRRMAE